MSATVSSGLPVSFSSLTTGICTVSGTTVHIVAVGNCTIRATQGGNDSYNAATPVDQSFTINPKAASVTPDIKSKTYGDADPTLTGTLSGFLAADNVTANYCRTTGETVTGSPYTVSATLSPVGVLSNYNITYNTAVFTIGKATSTTTVTCVGSFTYDGSAQTPCTVSVTGAGGLNLTPDPVYANNTNAGTATASYAYTGDDNHEGSSDSKTFTIDKADQAITFATTAPANVIAGGPTYKPMASSSSELTVAITLDALSTGCDLDGEIVSFTGAGTCIIDANQNGGDNFNAAPQVQQTINVYLWTDVFRGLFEPLSTTLKEFQKGSTIPVKFALVAKDGSGNFYGSVASLEVCNRVNATDCKTIFSSANPDGNFRYDDVAKQYIYNLSTKDTFFKSGNVYDFKITMFNTQTTDEILQSAMIKLGAK